MSELGREIVWAEQVSGGNMSDGENVVAWHTGTVVERRSLTGELSLSCARPAADG